MASKADSTTRQPKLWPMRLKRSGCVLRDCSNILRREYPAWRPTLSALCCMVKNEVASRKFATESWSSESIEGQCIPRASGENGPQNFGQLSGLEATRPWNVLAKPMENTLYSETAL